MEESNNNNNNADGDNNCYYDGSLGEGQEADDAPLPPLRIAEAEADDVGSGAASCRNCNIRSAIGAGK